MRTAMTPRKRRAVSPRHVDDDVHIAKARCGLPGLPGLYDVGIECLPGGTPLSRARLGR
jgi:hypothetical protein